MKLTVFKFICSILFTIVNGNEKLHFRNKILISSRDDCRCGKIDNKLANRITGGIRTEPKAYPWQALIMVQNTFCGGSVINELYILTAGHCTAPCLVEWIVYVKNNQGKSMEKKGIDFDSVWFKYIFQKEDITIRLGVYEIHNNTGTEQIYFVVKMIIHEDYLDLDSHALRDIALLKLNKQITFNDFVKPICLPNQYNQIEGKIITVTGWGSVDYGEEKGPSRFLREVQVKIFSKEKCLEDEVGKFITEDINTTFCASGNGMDACTGDSGGPAFHKTPNGIAVQFGIVAWGKGCGKYCGIYTKVSAFRNWIIKHTQDSNYCLT